MLAVLYSITIDTKCQPATRSRDCEAFPPDLPVDQLPGMIEEQDRHVTAAMAIEHPAPDHDHCLCGVVVALHHSLHVCEQHGASDACL